MLRPRLVGFGSLLVVGSLALAVATAQQPRPAARTSAGLIINAKFDPSITSDPRGATIQATINQAIQRYQKAFATPITVNITFKKGPVGLGESFTQRVRVQYTDYLKALNSAKANNPALARALMTLPAGPGNPVNKNASVVLSTANARALGFKAGPAPGQPDCVIILNTDRMNLTRTNIDRTKYDLMAVASHEMDEALGFGSSMDNLKNGDPAPTGPVEPDDLYRYNQNGVRSFNTSLATQAFYSIDGGRTKLARFNQDQRGDFGDWFSPGNVPHKAQVQDAFSTPGATPDLGVELTRLAVLGYTPASGSVRPAATHFLAKSGRLPSRPAAPVTRHLRDRGAAAGHGHLSGKRLNATPRAAR